MTLSPVLVALSLFGGLSLVHEIGYLAGRRARRRGKEQPSLSTVQGAVLGLLGLLLAFSYAGASGRFVGRQDLITREANAIGTAYLRADLLDEPSRGELKSLLRDYTAARLQLFHALERPRSADVRARLTALHDRIWTTGLHGVEVKPAMAVAVLPPINDVFDLLGERNAAAQRHLPGPVLGLLALAAAASVGTIAYGFGHAGERNQVTMWALVLLIASALWVTVDLDYPRLGLIQMSSAPLEALAAQVGPAPVATPESR